MIRRSAHLAASATLVLVAGGAFAQIDGPGRGVAAVASGGAFEVGGVRVDVAGANADAARTGGWRLAQRIAWTRLSQRFGRSGSAVGDGTLDGIVTGIVIEREEVGPRRYIATLGVLFDRSRAASLLGIPAYTDRSPPMLVLPVQFTGGVGQVFEARTPWHEAWARFRTGNSSIDYVRPAGTGADPLLLDLGQTGRPGRGWWRTIIDQYGASDVLIPTVRLERQWPGGPVIGRFQARFGPDNRLLGSFVLRVGTSAGLPQLLDTGVARLDALYQRALRSGALRVDAALVPTPPPEPEPADVPEGESLDSIISDIAPSATSTTVTVQFDTPSGAAVANTEAAVRAVPGVRAAQTASVALGGISLMRVTLDGDPAAFAAALQARGWQVVGSGATIRIRRPVPTATPTSAPGGAG